MIRLLVYSLALKVIVVSRELQTLLQRRYLLTADQVVRIPNGIDTSYYAPNPEERHRVRKLLGFTVVVAWEEFSYAEANVANEASTLATMYRQTVAMPGQEQQADPGSIAQVDNSREGT